MVADIEVDMVADIDINMEINLVRVDHRGWLIGPFFDPKLCEFIHFCGNYFCRISFTQF